MQRPRRPFERVSEDSGRFTSHRDCHNNKPRQLTCGGVHLISCCLHQISVFHLTEWMDSPDQLQEQSIMNAVRSLRWLLPTFFWPPLKSAASHSWPNTAVSQTANMKTAGTTYLLILPLSCRSYGITQRAILMYCKVTYMETNTLNMCAERI